MAREPHRTRETARRMGNARLSVACFFLTCCDFDNFVAGWERQPARKDLLYSLFDRRFDFLVDRRKLDPVEETWLVIQFDDPGNLAISADV